MSFLKMREGVLVAAQTLTEDDTAQSLVLEGFGLDLAEIFAG